MTKSESAPMPQRLGPFEVHGVLGRGGSGVVYRARWGHRQVALKVIRGGADAVSEKEQRRFLDEANRLATLGHPNVVKILGAGALDDGRPYLAMELLEGQSLGMRLLDGAIEPDRALSLFSQLAGAVSAMHEAGLIHRDLKPENVFLTADEEHALVLDFGIAKELDAPASTVTQEGGIRGTPATMAPERFFGSPASVASDIYELAVVLFAMLSGVLPWRSAGDPSDRLAPRRLHELGCDGLPMVDAAIARALSTRPEMRPQSAAELLHEVAAGAQTTLGQRRTADLHRGSSSQPPPVANRTSAVDSGIESAPTLPAMKTEPAPGDAPAGPRQVSMRWFALAGGLVATLAVVLAIALWPRGGEEGDDHETVVADDSSEDDGTKEIREPFVPRDGDDSGLDGAMKHHPADAHAMIAFRFREFRQSEAFQELITLGKSRPELLPLHVMKSSCGIDLIDDLDWVTISNSTVDGELQHEIMLAGNWKRDAVESCLAGFGGDVETVKDWLSVVDLDGDKVAVVWLDQRTALVSTRPSMPAEWFEDRRNGANSARDGALAALAAEVDRGATLWAVDVGHDLGLGEVLPDLPPPARQVVTFDVSSDLKLLLRVSYDSSDKAVAAAEVVRAKLQELRSDSAASMYLRKFEVSDKGTDVIVEGELDRALTQMTARFAESQLRGELE